MGTEAAAFTRWQHRVLEPEVATVLPDGCVDVLITCAPARPPRVVLTPLDARRREVQLEPGTQLVGYRLRPGSLVDPEALREASPETLAETLAETPGPLLVEDDDLQRAVQALASGLSPARAAARLGVSLRSLQRRLRKRGQPPPDFWRLLGRARAAADDLHRGPPLVEIAADHGFSDQAHMSREFVRWFGLSPRRLRDSPDLLAQLRQPGLGNWTAEQISTR